MTEEEYEARRTQLSETAEKQKRVLNDARNAYDKTCEELRMLRMDWNEQQRRKTAKPYFETHRYAGSSKDRADRGKPGHCEDCAKSGHVVAHPQLGCSDVGCDSHHPESEV